jgi:hypothetical protein
MLDLNGRVVVATDNAGAEWPDVRADCAIDMLNIGGPMTRNWERHRLGRCYRRQYNPRADEGGGRATDQLTQ